MFPVTEDSNGAPGSSGPVSGSAPETEPELVSDTRPPTETKHVTRREG